MILCLLLSFINFRTVASFTFSLIGRQASKATAKQANDTFSRVSLQTAARFYEEVKEGVSYSVTLPLPSSAEVKASAAGSRQPGFPLMTKTQSAISRREQVGMCLSTSTVTCESKSQIPLRSGCAF